MAGEEVVDRPSRFESVLGLAMLLVGGAAALAQSHAPIPSMIVLLIVVGGVWEWWTLRKKNSEARAVGYRLLVLVGLAFVALASTAK